MTNVAFGANASTSIQTGWHIGFWWAELPHPYWEFTEKGYEVNIFSADGDDKVPLLEELCRIWIHLAMNGMGRSFALKVMKR